MFILEILFLFIEKKEIITSPFLHRSYENKCITKETKYINGFSMEPLLKNTDKIILEKNYYKCNKTKPKKGDIIAFTHANLPMPFVKIIKATENDIVEFKENTLLINNKAMTNSNNEIYIFTQHEKKLLNLFIKNNKIGLNQYLVFGDNVQNSRDSRKFGVITIDNIIGKFILKK